MRLRKVMAAVGLGLGCLMITATAPAQSDTTGKVTIESTSVALGVGVAWGDGTLLYRGKEYKFSLDGLSVGDFEGLRLTMATAGVDVKLKK
jgi:hypothetical protein